MAQFAFQIDEAGIAAMGATMQDVTNELAGNIARDAAADAPVLTGYLKSSIGVKKSHAKNVALVVADAPHAGLVHNGTSRGAKANPFVRRAAEKNFEHVQPRGE